MDRRPSIALVFMVVSALAGCRAGTSNNLSRPAPVPMPTREAIDKDRFISLHNTNARAIRSLRALPGIELTEGNGKKHSLRGRMALERPNNFDLEILGPVKSEVAKIGSNDQGFWFWVRDNEDREIYTCAYENIDASPLAATFQPDWIIEAMGLRVIEPTEAKVISARPGDKKDSLILTQLRKDARGEMLTKETVVDVRDGKILEHRLYSGAKTQLLARATIFAHGEKEMLATANAPTATRIHYPSKFRLEWVAEKFSLDIEMTNPTLNPRFEETVRRDLFTEPKVPGYTRVDLATLGGTERASTPAPSSRIHETRPAPLSGSGTGTGIKLGEPQPFGDGAMQTSADPLALSLDDRAFTSRSLGVVGAPIPRPDEPRREAAISSAGANRLRGPIVER